VNNRAITWLLATLLAIATNAAVPVARTRAGGDTSAIVWIAQDQTKKRVLVHSLAVPPSAARTVLFTYQPPAKTQNRATSLYQRPPPFLR
jgi:hypothetical protein